MARSGILGQSKPAAATNTLLYSAPVDSSASTVLTIANDGTGSTYSVAVKEYDQSVTLDASTYLLHAGDTITNHRFALSSPVDVNTGISSGDVLTADDGESTAKFSSFYIPPFTEIHVKEETLKRITVESVNGTMEVGETISKGVAPDDTTAVVYEYASAAGGSFVWIGPETINGAGTAFADGDSVQTASGSGTIAAGGVGTAEDRFVFSFNGAGGDYSVYNESPFQIFGDRTYRFDVSDSSMTGRDFKLSEVVNGEWGPDGTFGTGDDGTEYTTGKTTNGTAGSAGAYVQYPFGDDPSRPRNVYYYDGGTGTPANSSYGGETRIFETLDETTFNEIYVYDLVGTWTTSSDSFTVNATTYVVSGQTSGKWGTVKDYSGTTLNIILGINSPAFVATDTFLDLPLDTTAVRSTAEISSVDVNVTDIPASSYLAVNVTNAANNVDRITSLVVGAGERVLVSSATQNNIFTLVGFEDNSTEITTRNYG